MTELTKQLIECVDAWKRYMIYAKCQDSSSNMTYTWYNEELQKLNVDDNTIFTITFKDGGSYTSIGLEKLDEYIRENALTMNVKTFSKVGGF